MDKLYWLDQIQLQDRTKVGDKAFYLSKIKQRGYPVVPGFVVSGEVLQEFLESLNSSESLVADLPHSSLHLDVENWRQLQQVAGRLRQEIITASVASDWISRIFQAARQWENHSLILRPSLTLPNTSKVEKNVSGLLESVFCACNEEAIAQALKLTWSQLFRARSLLYWHSISINLQHINLAVLVQPVENAITSGIFNSNSSGWEIEATWGLGLAITNGEVLPDVYYIEEKTGVIKEQQLGNKILAYRVHDSTSVAVEESVSKSFLENNYKCLLAYPVSEDEQKQYALSAEYLQQLIILGNQLVSELGSKLQIKWTITEGKKAPKLYITQVSYPHAVLANLHLIKGIGASRGKVTATAYVINNLQPKPEHIPKGVILIAPAVTPDWLPLLNDVVGIVTERGGLTSHGAILSRELGIPAVVSATSATNLMQTGERLLLDGDRGEIYRHRGDGEEVKGENQSHKYFAPLTPNLPMIATQLLVNLSQSNLISQVLSLPVDGVGLLRSELMVLNILQGQNPHAWLLGGKKTELLELWSEEIKKFTCAFAPKPVLYRSLDWRLSDLPSWSDTSSSSPQSMLGERGTLSYLRNPTLFEFELKALAKVQQAGFNNLHLLLPFVRTVEEFIFCRRKVEEAGLTQVSQFQLWIMAEVPSVLFLLPEYIKAGVAGISIGTNDLTQLILGVDREQGELAKIFDERHPAVMSAIAQLIKMAKDGGIPCSICGQAPALYPEIIDKLVEWGISSISVEPEAVERTYQAIARAEHGIILAAARKQLGDYSR
ncbi:phosphoenolpyruvate synthase [Sphaerospermopsis aphanizomenoides BCCUSP55]|uniref:putative PEP-binding protein n=1 Tax=Sphaerospermopsis aphanizomenoides TaxID=459663 RepID=UPI0019081E10|nr:putative PEP-binding protein [Sphaerospermopsis aphanizomenoides]MBK1986038.1 phosphoenolpyruvate synthase [Sphaerospermopsis aphanizomenoides BCCUSP55]